MQTFCVRIIPGVRKKGESGSVEMGIRGLAFIIVGTSVIRVESTS